MVCLCYMPESCNYCSEVFDIASACWIEEDGHRYLQFDCTCGKEISIPEFDFNPADYYSKTVISSQPRVYE